MIQLVPSTCTGQPKCTLAVDVAQSLHNLYIYTPFYLRKVFFFKNLKKKFNKNN